MHTDPDAHQRMTQRHKQGDDKKTAEAQLEKGLLIVNTGTGKGKPPPRSAWGCACSATAGAWGWSSSSRARSIPRSADFWAPSGL